MDMYLSLFRMAVLYGEMVLNKTSKTLCKLSAPRRTASDFYPPHCKQISRIIHPRLFSVCLWIRSFKLIQLVDLIVAVSFCNSPLQGGVWQKLASKFCLRMLISMPHESSHPPQTVVIRNALFHCARRKTYCYLNYLVPIWCSGEIFFCKQLMNTNLIAIFTLITDILVYGYNMKSYGALPVIHCFSCMSFSYQEHWSTMRYIYRRPELFTDRCNEPFMSRGIPVHNCTTICVTMKEPEIKGGLILGYNYIRGCADKVLISGFNRSALDTHRFPFVDVCRLLPRNQLINSRELNQIVVGDVHICGCYGNRCNGGGSRRTPTAPFILLVTFLLIAAQHHFSTSTYF
ncbi:hypothetical protein T12_15293 [Trichinella patagoniensis]|uniref:Uncharacterized protein n=1 Tax=Trichinella patagoniensis TaxID=990121 RepID=A0A0V0ZE24_9BILA|nr:hypothetical protein T12_15293 [Trichinella patagoniensis]